MTKIAERNKIIIINVKYYTDNEYKEALWLLKKNKEVFLILPILITLNMYPFINYNMNCIHRYH